MLGVNLVILFFMIKNLRSIAQLRGQKVYALKWKRRKEGKINKESRM